MTESPVLPCSKSGIRKTMIAVMALVAIFAFVGAGAGIILGLQYGNTDMVNAFIDLFKTLAVMGLGAFIAVFKDVFMDKD